MWTEMGSENWSRGLLTIREKVMTRQEKEGVSPFRKLSFCMSTSLFIDNMARQGIRPWVHNQVPEVYIGPSLETFWAA